MPISSDDPSDRESAGNSRPAPEADVPLDVLFRILSDRRRRRILLFLSVNDETDVSIDELTDRLMADEAMSREALSTALYHNHIPQLVSAGLLERNSELHTVRYRPSPRLEQVFETVSTDGR